MCMALWELISFFAFLDGIFYSIFLSVFEDLITFNALHFSIM